MTSWFLFVVPCLRLMQGERSDARGHHHDLHQRCKVKLSEDVMLDWDRPEYHRVEVEYSLVKDDHSSW